MAVQNVGNALVRKGGQPVPGGSSATRRKVHSDCSREVRSTSTGREAPYVDVGDPEQIAIGHRAGTGFVAKAAQANPITPSPWAGRAEMPNSVLTEWPERL